MEDHLKHNINILESLRMNSLYAKESKCAFTRNELLYLEFFQFVYWDQENLATTSDALNPTTIFLEEWLQFPHCMSHISNKYIIECNNT